MAKDSKAKTKRGSTAAVKPVLAPESMSTARKIAWWSLLAMIFVVPIAMGNITWIPGVKLPITYDQFDIVKVFFQRVLGLIALGAWSWDLLVRGGKVRRTPVDWLILAFLGWVVLATVFSIHVPTSIFGKYRRFEGLLSFINYAVIYFLVLQFADRPSRIKALAVSLFCSSVVVAGYGVLQAVGLDPIKWGALPFEQFRPFSTYGNPDLLGGYLMFSLPVALGLALTEKKMWMRVVYWVGFAMNAYVWVVAFTRGAWIGGAIGLAILGVIAWRNTAKLNVVDYSFAGLTGAIGAAAIIKSLANPNEVMNFGKRFASILQFEAGSGRTRTEIWHAAIDAIKARPVFGFGPDTFRLVFPTYKPFGYVKDAGYLSVADNVHDYPLQLAAGIGIFGMLLMYGVFGWAAVRSAPWVFKRTNDPNRILLGAFWAAAAGYLVQLMFGLSVTGNTFLLWAAMAVVLAPTASIIEFKAPSWGMAVGSVLLVLAALGIGYQVVLIQADHAYLLARVIYQGPQRTAAAIEAAALNPWSDSYRAEVGLAYTDEVFSNVNAASQAQQQGQSPAPYVTAAREKLGLAERSLLDTIRFVPPEYDNYVFLSNLYNAAGQMFDPRFYTDAIKTAQKGVVVEPNGPAIRVQLARALAATGQRDQAIKQLELAVRMDPAYAEASVTLAEQYQKAGRIADGIRVLKAIETVNPGQTGVSAALKALEASVTTAP